MKRLTTIAFLVLAAIAVGRELGFDLSGIGSPTGVISRGDAEVQEAFERRISDIQVSGEGRVVRVLADDNDGSRHQRFILKLETGQTLLVAHNIDLADRVPGLEPGDVIEFNGEYEWNAKGGVIHWTHHDPQGRHQGGWLKHRGTTYE